MHLTAETLRANCSAWMARLTQFVEDGDVLGQELALCQLAVTHNHLHRYDEALEFFNRALRLNKLSRNSVRRFWALMGAGVAYVSKFEIPLAVEYFQHALALSYQIGDEALIHYSKSNLEMACRSSGIRLSQNETFLNFRQGLHNPN